VPIKWLPIRLSGPKISCNFVGEENELTISNAAETEIRAKIGRYYHQVDEFDATAVLCIH
jgi:hypothetical protein